MIIAGDLSLRSSGLVALSMDGDLIDFNVIQSVKPGSKQVKKRKQLVEKDRNDLLIYNAKSFIKFIDTLIVGNICEGFVIEGLAFGATSGNKDIIAGNWWVTNVYISKKYPTIPFGEIPVTRWRNSLTTKEERKEGKELYGNKANKQIVVDKLPKIIYNRFIDFIEQEKLKADTLFDLADAWGIAEYRRQI